MSYRLNLFENNLWSKICKFEAWVRRYNDVPEQELEQMLRNHNAVDVYGTGFIEFETEEDLLIFLLKIK